MITVVYTGTRQPDDVAGLEIVHLPMLERVALALPPTVSEELAATEPVHQHAVFYSQNAAELVLDTLGDALAQANLWAVGESTAATLHDLTGRDARVPKRHDFTGVATMLRKSVRADDLVLSFELAGSDRRLDEMGLPARVRSIPSYDTVATNWDDLDGLLRRVAPRWVVFASPRAFRAFRDNLHHRVVGDSYRVAAIGPTTRDAIEAAGDRVDLMPARPDLDALLAEIAENG